MTTNTTYPAQTNAELDPPPVVLDPAVPAPTRVIKSEELRQLGNHLQHLFLQYVSDRRILELKWLRNLRQYRGQYDPEIEKEMAPNRSKAYPRVTRAKCISVLSRIMNLMFPGDERNWALKASPSPDMSPQDVQIAIQKYMQKQQQAGLGGNGPPITDEDVQAAVQDLADERADALSLLIDDQLQEIGGDQTGDYISLNRKVIRAGVMYGIGVLVGPYVKMEKGTKWGLDPMTGQPAPQEVVKYKPVYEYLSPWDYYPDLSAKTLDNMDGYFKRLIMARGQVRELANRPDFFGDVIKEYLNRHKIGNYKALPFETEIRAQGVKVNVNEQKTETTKFEIIIWNGKISGDMLALAGVEIPDDQRSDDVEAEIWMIDGNVIKADINPWRKLGVDIKTAHVFLFDEDETSPTGEGLPNVMRDSQMSIAAATRMLLDNASAVCGPQLELNTDLLRLDQDLAASSAYKVWYREGTGPDAAVPAVRNVTIDAHLPDLLKIIETFMNFADMETFVNPSTGGDMTPGRTLSEPYRTAAGASMLRGEAALPFKDIIRSFDKFTQSWIYSLVWFNKKFNPDLAPEGDYNVIARGATSLIAKEIRGTQVDQLAATLRPEEMVHVDERKLVEARFASRDLRDLLVSESEAKRRQDAQQQQMAQQTAIQQAMMEAERRKTYAESYKNITQGQKNSAAADAHQVDAVLSILEQGAANESDQSKATGTRANS